MCVHGPWLLRGAPAKETGLCSNLYYSCYITQTAIELENLFLFNCACYTGKASTFLPSDLQTWNTSILFQVQRFLMTGCSRISLKSVNNLFFFCQTMLQWPCGSNYCLRLVSVQNGKHSCDDRVNLTTLWQQSRPILMNRQRETQSNYVWCYYGICFLLVKNHPIISRSESFQGIAAIVSCNFVVAQMMRNVT